MSDLNNARGAPTGIPSQALPSQLLPSQRFPGRLGWAQGASAGISGLGGRPGGGPLEGASLGLGVNSRSQQQLGLGKAGLKSSTPGSRLPDSRSDESFKPEPAEGEAIGNGAFEANVLGKDAMRWGNQESSGHSELNGTRLYLGASRHLSSAWGSALARWCTLAATWSLARRYAYWDPRLNLGGFQLFGTPMSRGALLCRAEQLFAAAHCFPSNATSEDSLCMEVLEQILEYRSGLNPSGAGLLRLSVSAYKLRPAPARSLLVVYALADRGMDEQAIRLCEIQLDQFLSVQDRALVYVALAELALMRNDFADALAMSHAAKGFDSSSVLASSMHVLCAALLGNRDLCMESAQTLENCAWSGDPLWLLVLEKWDGRFSGLASSKVRFGSPRIEGWLPECPLRARQLLGAVFT